MLMPYVPDSQQQKTTKSNNLLHQKKEQKNTKKTQKKSRTRRNNTSKSGHTSKIEPPATKISTLTQNTTRTAMAHGYSN